MDKLDKSMEKIVIFFASALAFAAAIILTLNFWDGWLMTAIILVSLVLAALLTLMRQLSRVEKMLDKLLEEKKEE